MPPSRKARLLAYVSAWIIALMITCPFGINLLPLFPLGIFLALNFNMMGGNEMGYACAGWVLYTIHAAFLFITSSRTFYYVAYAILLIMLITNVTGCRNLLVDLSQIH